MRFKYTIFLFLVFIYSLPFSTAAQFSRETDSLALLTIYDSLDGENWTAPWDLTKRINTYAGVMVDNNRVVYLDFGRITGVKGNIPEALGNLNELKHLIVGDWGNYIAKVPGSIRNLQNLEILEFIGNNYLLDYPEQIGELKGIKSLKFYESPGNMKFNISKMKNLTELDFFYTLAPQGVFEGGGSLKSLKTITGNFLLTAEICSISSLETLHIDADPYRYSFYFTIPDNIGNLTNLRSLKFQNTRYSDSPFTGEIPTSLFSLKKLEILQLENSHLSALDQGIFFDSLYLLSGLKTLLVYNLKGSSSFPAKFSELKNLEVARLTSCGLQGGIPNEVTDMNALKVLSLGQNEISSIPDFSSSNIQTLYLPYNRIDYTSLKPMLTADNFYLFPQLIPGYTDTLCIGESHISSPYTDEHFSYTWEDYYSGQKFDTDLDSILTITLGDKPKSVRLSIKSEKYPKLYFSNFINETLFSIESPISLISSGEQCSDPGEALSILSAAGSEALLLYPNPTNDQIHIASDIYNHGKFKLIDLAGKVKLENNWTKDRPLDVSHIEKGIYIVVIHDSDNHLLIKRKVILK
ncbi:MAG: T9SS type A sorting domain-containing protein [Reichenbachiella sp.]